MARIRSLKPEFWHDRKLARACSRDARMLYMGLWNQADEHRRCNGDLSVIRGQVFPYDDDVNIGALLAELVAARRVFAYEVEGDPYLFLPKLAEHQRLEPAKVASKFPDPPAEFPDTAQIFSDSHNTANPQVDGFSDESEKTVVESENSGEPSALLYVSGSMEHGGKSAPQATQPALDPQPPERAPRKTLAPDEFPITDRMVAWADSRCPNVDLDRETERFLSSHRSKGNRFVDWGQAWRTWMTNSFPKAMKANVTSGSRSDVDRKFG